MQTSQSPDVKITVTGEALLSPQETEARSAVIDFYWDLTLARARKPNDPGLSADDANRVRSILGHSANELQTRANALWTAWEEVRGNSKVNDLFTKQALDGLVTQVARVQTPFQTAEEMNAAFREVLSTKDAAA